MVVVKCYDIKMVLLFFCLFITSLIKPEATKQQQKTVYPLPFYLFITPLIKPEATKQQRKNSVPQGVMKTSVKMGVDSVDGRRPMSTRKPQWSTSTS